MGGSALALGRLLAPGTQAWSTSSASADRITASDVAAMMAGARPIAERLYRLVAAGDVSCVADVERWLYVRIIDQAARERWRDAPSQPGEQRVRRGDDLIRRLVRMALEDLLTGRRLTGEERAESLGVHRRNWERTWRARYAQVESSCWAEIGSVVGLMRGRMG